jgi:hypothetical protein
MEPIGAREHRQRFGPYNIPFGARHGGTFPNPGNVALAAGRKIGNSAVRASIESGLSRTRAIIGPADQQCKLKLNRPQLPGCGSRRGERNRGRIQEILMEYATIR